MFLELNDEIDFSDSFDKKILPRVYSLYNSFGGAATELKTEVRNNKKREEEEIINIIKIFIRCLE